MNRYPQGGGGARRGELQDITEDVMCAVPRGDGHEEMRVVFVQARSADGKRIAWHSVGVYWRGDDGVWRRGKSVATIRGKELRAVTEALLKATATTVGPPSAETPAPRRAPEHRQTRANQPALPEPPPGRFDDDDGMF